VVLVVTLPPAAILTGIAVLVVGIVSRLARLRLDRRRATHGTRG